MPRIIQRETAACIGAGADPTLWELRRRLRSNRAGRMAQPSCVASGCLLRPGWDGRATCMPLHGCQKLDRLLVPGHAGIHLLDERCGSPPRLGPFSELFNVARVAPVRPPLAGDRPRGSLEPDQAGHPIGAGAANSTAAIPPSPAASRNGRSCPAASSTASRSAARVSRFEARPCRRRAPFRADHAA